MFTPDDFVLILALMTNQLHQSSCQTNHWSEQGALRETCLRNRYSQIKGQGILKFHTLMNNSKKSVNVFQNKYLNGHAYSFIGQVKASSLHFSNVKISLVLSKNVVFLNELSFLKNNLYFVICNNVYLMVFLHNIFINTFMFSFLMNYFEAQRLLKDATLLFLSTKSKAYSL